MKRTIPTPPTLRTFCVLSLCCLTACTQPGETTGIGAAAGGALGAGLGAIIGSQSGSAGSGLAIGAVAGSASGALIGNAFQAQQEAIRTQDEALERQERMVQAQKTELDELRRLKSDTEPRRVSRSTSRTSTSPQPPKVARDSVREATRSVDPLEPAPRAKMRDEAATVESDLVAPLEREAPEPPATSPAPSPKKSPTLGDFEESATTARLPSRPTSSSCSQADEEQMLATNSPDVSEKLFHLRRALRLCPNSAVAHHELGKVYLTLKRPADAEYEFKQALAVDPEFKAAAKSLNQLQSSSSTRF
jgi:hypothetical protein